MAADFEYTAGQLATFTGTFTASNGNPVDPGTVTFLYAISPPASPPNSTITLTYTGSSQPTVGMLVRTGVGVYVAVVDTTALPGYWVCEFKSTGVGQTISPPTFSVVVNPAAL